MPYDALPLQYAQESKPTGVTALSGLATYLDMARAAGLSESVRRHVGVREGSMGWTDAQTVISLVLLNLAGGESVDDLRLLEKDEGLSRLLWSEQTHGLRRRERRAWERGWRGERNRSVPSASAVFRYLSEFHDPEEEIRRQPHTAFIPADNDALRGLKKVNVDMVGFVQRHAGQVQATLDMDATLIETHKSEDATTTKTTPVELVTGSTFLRRLRNSWTKQTGQRTTTIARMSSCIAPMAGV